MTRLQTNPGDIELGRRWRPYLDAIELPVDDLKPFDIFLLAGAVMVDPLVQPRVSAPPLKPIISEDDYMRVLSKLTEDEKAEIRERVLAKK